VNLSECIKLFLRFRYFFFVQLGDVVRHLLTNLRQCSDAALDIDYLRVTITELDACCLPNTDDLNFSCRNFAVSFVAILIVYLLRKSSLHTSSEHEAEDPPGEFFIVFTKSQGIDRAQNCRVVMRKAPVGMYYGE
jgi:hypothetical protein